jgi:hypothetical protein
MAKIIATEEHKPIILPLPGRAVPAHEPAPVNQIKHAPAIQVSLRPPLSASYSYDRKLHQVIITLQRPDTGQVVAQIPSQAVLSVVSALVDISNRSIDTEA